MPTATAEIFSTNLHVTAGRVGMAQRLLSMRHEMIEAIGKIERG
jgi:hypothetical protein